MRKRLILSTTVIALAGLGYLVSTRLTGSAQELQLNTAKVLRGDVVRTIDATGRLEAVTTVQVGTQVSGTIKALHADFNSRVSKGQVVAELEPSIFQSQVDQAQATVARLQAEADRAGVQAEDARAKAARARQLAAQQLLAAADVETAVTTAAQADAAVKSAEAQVVQARASLNQAQVNLNNTIIRAPIDGVVISRNVDVGQTVAASMQAPTLFQIANDLTRMQVSASIDEADIGEIHVGQPVTFQVDAFPDERFSGKVSQVRLNPTIEQNVVSYTTIIDVANADLKLRPGMTATVTVEVARASDTLNVPAAALRFAPTPEVFASLGQSARPPAGRPGSIRPVVANQREARQEVRAPQPGLHGNGGTLWILAEGGLQPLHVDTGISDGAAVAVSGAGLREGMQVVTGVVQPKQASAAPASGSPLIPQRTFGRRGGAAAPNRNAPVQGGSRGAQ